MGGPEILAGKELLDHFFMVVGLILFSVIPLHRPGCMPVQGLASIFTAADGLIRILLMEGIEPRTVHGNLSPIPTEIVVVRDNVAYMNYFLVNTADSKHGGGRKSCLVHSMAEIVEDSMVLQHIRILRVPHGYFI